MAPLLTVDVHVAPGDRRAALAHDARTGLTATPKWLSPVWFYDERGSDLFDRITRLPEYYPTRAERSILAARSGAIAAAAGADTLVELGSGTSDKTRLLLDAMAVDGRLRRFVPFDVSEETLRRAAADIAAGYGIEVAAIVGDFHRHLDQIPRDGSRLVAFLGGTIGNLRPAERARFLGAVAATLGPADRLLLGTDLVKDRARLVAAYDDAAGVTAAFNRNVLAVLDHELGATFDPQSFDHVAVWNEAERWIEMRLRSTVAQRVAVRDLGLVVTFEPGEDLLTEISAKFTPSQVEAELAGAGLLLDHAWTDPAGDFLVTLSRPLRL
jgi:L-histidine Nalpha-methyltransferase